jgi:hypothetical protein
MRHPPSPLSSRRLPLSHSIVKLETTKPLSVFSDFTAQTWAGT